MSTPNLSSQRTARANGFAYRLAWQTAAVAGIFSLIVCALMAYDFTRRRFKDPFEATAYKAVQAALVKSPASEELKEEVRRLDLDLREEYFRQRLFAQTGAALVLVGAVVFFGSAQLAASLRRRLPEPAPRAASQDIEAGWTRAGRFAVGIVGMGLVGTALFLSTSLTSLLPTEESMTEEAANEESPTDPSPTTLARVEPRKTAAAVVAHLAAASYAPTADEISKAWPRFRGPTGSGISPFTNVPDTWDGPSGKNIAWRAPVPLPGNSSPVVCGKRIFLTGSDDKLPRCQVYCFRTDDGKLLWQKDVPVSKPVTVTEYTGYASATVATDGRRAYAIFASGDVAALDYDGNVVWSRSLGPPENAYGHAASLLTWENLLIVPFDQATLKANKSKLLALDSATGKTVWETPRPVPASWSTPILIRHANRQQIITTANPWVIAYNPADGAELWRAKCLHGEVGPSPVFADGLAYVAANDSTPLSAIRIDGQGDVTASHVSWKAEDNTPDTSSPLATESYVFAATTSGMLTAYDAKSGDMLWEEDFGKVQFKASPSLIGNRLLLIGEKGEGLFVEPSKTACKRVGEANLGEACVSSPAFQQGRIYLRGAKHLFAIGTK